MGRTYPTVNCRHLFTLIELMVVVLIIAILFSMLAPALGGVRSKARCVACMSNQRQIGYGVAMYADEFDGFSIPAQPADPIQHWANYLYADIAGGEERIFQCPCLSLDQMHNPYGGKGEYGLSRTSYVINIIREEGVQGWSYHGADISSPYPVSFGWSSGTARDPVRLSRVKDPCSKIMIVDAPPHLTHNSTGIGILRLHETDHGEIDRNGNGKVNAGEREVGWHHGGGFAALFGDGHVEKRFRSEHEEWNVHQYTP